jgi:hypothetical protein
MTKWPENLIEEIASRRAIIFLGSGVSASSVNKKGESPLDWKSFLLKSITMMRRDSESCVYAEELIDKMRYLDALQVIWDCSDPGAFAKFLRDEFISKDYVPNEIHKAIKDIDSKIVITTNFDKIYDSICREYTYEIIEYSKVKNIACVLKTPQSLIIKAHGELTDPSSIIFTSKQFFDAQLNYPGFYQILKALFITNTILFLGYSLSDPDINLVLQEIKNTANVSAPHYILLKSGNPKYELDRMMSSYNVACLEYGPNYSDMEESILNLADQVRDFREERALITY